MGIESYAVLILATLAVTPALLRILRGRAGANLTLVVFIGVDLLLRPGEISTSRFDALLRQRDDRPMVLSE